jgi:hypothetical protein
MRSLLLLLLFPISSLAQVVYEDWSCYTFTAAVSVAGGKTNLTCNATHGWSTGTTLVIYGGTGNWTAINTQVWEVTTNLMKIGATDTGVIIVNDTSKMQVPGFHQIDNETVYVTSATAGTVTIGPGGGCSTGRGCGGSTAAAHTSQAGWVCNFNPSQRVAWTATVIDAVTIQIGLDSSGLGSFTGQNLTVRRTQNSAYAEPLGVTYLGQPWASYDSVGPDGLTINIPGCTDPTNAFVCARGYLTITSTKGYSFNPGGIPVSSMVVSGTPPNQIGTVTFTNPFTQPSVPGANTIRAVSTAASFKYAGSIIWADGFDETATGLNSLNRPYMIQSVTTNGGGQVTQITVKIDDGINLPNGTYSTGLADVFPCSTNPCMALPWPGDPYMDFNLTTGNYPTNTISQYIKYGATWDPTFNMMQVQYKWTGISQVPYANGFPPMDQGGYPHTGTDLQDTTHTYQDGAGPIVSGQWAQFDWTAIFEHIVGANNNYLYEYEPFINGGYFDVPPNWAGGTYHFWDGTTRIYFDWSGPPYNTVPLIGGSITYKKVILYKKSGEPFEFVHGTGIVYDGTQYQVGWIGPRQNLYMFGWTYPITYNVAYSTTSDLKSIGFSNGTSGGQVNNAAGLGDVVSYTSPPMAQASTFYVGIRPITPVWAVSPNGASPIWYWTIADPQLDTSSHITTTGIGGNGNVTNTAVTAVAKRQFWTLYQPQTNLPWTTPDGLTSITSDSSSNCTVNLTVSHGLVTGWPVLISNPPTGLFADTNSHVVNVTSTPTSSTFVFSCPSATPSSTFNTDTVAGYTYRFTVMPLAGTAVAGTGSGISLSSGTLVATDDTTNFAEIIFSPGSSPPPPATGLNIKGNFVIKGSAVIH